MKRFKSVCPDYPHGHHLVPGQGPQPWYLRRGQGRWIAGVDFLKPDKALVRTLPLPGGRERAAWTVDDPAEARRLLSLGCSGIISNRPHELGI